MTCEAMNIDKVGCTGKAFNAGFFVWNLKKFREEKFLISSNKGYNAFYLISGGSDLEVEDDEIEIDGKVTSSKLKMAFMKMSKKRQVNRVLVSKFIQGIAA